MSSGTYYKFYHYDPSLAGACIFAVLFGLSTLWHVVLVAQHRAWFFIPVVVGGTFEIVGYIARAISHQEAPAHLSLGPYVIQTLLLLVAPPLFAATLYMMLSRIMASMHAESQSLIKIRWLTRYFVTSDVICFFIQLGGAGLMASSTSSTASTGSRIVLAGLILQIIIFGFFLVVAGVWHRRVLIYTDRGQSDQSSPPWKRHMRDLYLASALILLRNVVRVAEFVEGFHGFIILHESFLYVFDAMPMLVVMLIFNIVYPSVLSNRHMAAKKDEERQSVAVLRADISESKV